MRTNLLLLFAALILVITSCSQEKNITPTGEETEQKTPLSKREINEIVEKSLFATGEFKWSSVNAHTVWSALQAGNQVMSIGYKPANVTNLNDNIHLIDLNASEWVAAKNKVINTVLESERKTNPNLQVEDIKFSESKYLPFVQLKVTSVQTVEALRSLPETRYADVSGYNPIDSRSDSGCGLSPANPLYAADYTTTTPGSKIPWNFNNHSIPSAWALTSGKSVTVGLIDTGVSDGQDKLGSKFNDGSSTGRTIQKYSTHYTGWFWPTLDTPHDQCGHGTQMAGLISAPRSDEGNSIGVAYNCNLVAIRGTTDVVIGDSDEKDGVSDALVYLGNRTDVKIISMSIGDVFYSGQVADAVIYAYNKGKLIFAAGGTSLTWTSWYGVIFPASMAEAVAVTGVKDGATMERCDVCHSGSDIEFVVIMQRASDTSRKSLTLALSGNAPAYVGGSSAATATTAGMAALVWAKNPTFTRAQVLTRMKTFASNYPNRHGEFGWGAVNALKAVRGY